ncbi:helix-turn-helix domain-containing protein [Cerasicoccus fimbriatus]|uniref:helix-turn-helix domain-containing protein n=1 Tax=Cerasicoccus fimbriatus TaxID=3014554 RepID=UPI0022B54A41|nr:helix-turn-helix domain-containing protein [Cerasicoccus sp. TK19100]
MSNQPVLKADTYYSRNAAIGIFRMPDQNTIPEHEHEFVEIALVIGGKGVHVTGQYRHNIGRGDVLVIRGQRSHFYEQTRKLSLINIMFAEDLLRESTLRIGALDGFHPLFTFEFTRWEQREYTGHFRLGESDLRASVDCINGIETELNLGGIESDYLARCRLQILLGMLARCYGRSEQSPSNLDRRLGEVLTRIDKYPHVPYTVTDMALDAGMSKRSLLRYFKKATDQSPTAYVLKKRIQLAEILLKEARADTMTDIAFHCGFSDSNYFSRLFKQHTGMSPRQYRQLE